MTKLKLVWYTYIAPLITVLKVWKSWERKDGSVNRFWDSSILAPIQSSDNRHFFHPHKYQSTYSCWDQYYSLSLLFPCDLDKSTHPRHHGWSIPSHPLFQYTIPSLKSRNTLHSLLGQHGDLTLSHLMTRLELSCGTTQAKTDCMSQRSTIIGCTLYAMISNKHIGTH